MEDPGPGQCPRAPGETEWPAGPPFHADPRQGVLSSRDTQFTAVGGTIRASSHVPSQGLAGAWAQRGGGKARPNTHSSQKAWPASGHRVAPYPLSSSQPAGLLSVPGPLSARLSIHPPVVPPPTHPHTAPALRPSSAPPSRPTPSVPPAHTAPSRVHQLSSEAPATGGQVSPRHYLHPRRWQRQRPRPVCLESPLWSLPGERAGGRGPLATLALTRGWVG